MVQRLVSLASEGWLGIVLMAVRGKGIKWIFVWVCMNSQLIDSTGFGLVTCFCVERSPIIARWSVVLSSGERASMVVVWLFMLLNYFQLF